MKTGLMLLMLAAMLLPACADTNGNSRYRNDAVIDRANLCATCGASVSGNYFDASAFKAIGPGNY